MTATEVTLNVGVVSMEKPFAYQPGGIWFRHTECMELYGNPNAQDYKNLPRIIEALNYAYNKGFQEGTAALSKVLCNHKKDGINESHS